MCLVTLVFFGLHYHDIKPFFRALSYQANAQHICNALLVKKPFQSNYVSQCSGFVFTLVSDISCGEWFCRVINQFTGQQIRKQGENNKWSQLHPTPIVTICALCFPHYWRFSYGKCILFSKISMQQNASMLLSLCFWHNTSAYMTRTFWNVGTLH